MKDSRRPDHVSLACMVGRSREGGYVLTPPTGTYRSGARSTA